MGHTCAKQKKRILNLEARVTPEKVEHEDRKNPDPPEKRFAGEEGALSNQKKKLARRKASADILPMREVTGTTRKERDHFGGKKKKVSSAPSEKKRGTSGGRGRGSKVVIVPIYKKKEDRT